MARITKNYNKHLWPGLPSLCSPLCLYICMCLYIISFQRTLHNALWQGLSRSYIKHLQQGMPSLCSVLCLYICIYVYIISFQKKLHKASMVRITKNYFMYYYVRTNRGLYIKPLWLGEPRITLSIYGQDYHVCVPLFAFISACVGSLCTAHRQRLRTAAGAVGLPLP